MVCVAKHVGVNVGTHESRCVGIDALLGWFLMLRLRQWLSTPAPDKAQLLLKITFVLLVLSVAIFFVGWTVLCLIGWAAALLVAGAQLLATIHALWAAATLKSLLACIVYLFNLVMAAGDAVLGRVADLVEPFGSYLYDVLVPHFPVLKRICFDGAR